jgi:hypothetical protein
MFPVRYELNLCYIALSAQHPLSSKLGTNLADKWWSLGRFSSLADYSHGVSY